jgi:hypothetical protein
MCWRRKNWPRRQANATPRYSPGAAHWRRYDLDRLPDDPQLWARAAEILRQLPEARVGVGPQPITAAAAADECERRAKGP